MTASMCEQHRPRVGMQVRWDDPGREARLDWFAERSVRGLLTRMVGAWLVVGLPVIAARIWWSVAAAIVVFVGTVSAYVTFAVRYVRRHGRPA